MQQYTTVLDGLPLWGLFFVIVVFVLLSIEGGYRLGHYRRIRSEREKDAPVGAMVGSTLGLLAFMLAFTFGMAAARFDTRKALVVDEANAIGTTYLRAALLPDRRDECGGSCATTWMRGWRPFSRAASRKAFGGRRTCRPSLGEGRGRRIAAVK